MINKVTLELILEIEDGEIVLKALSVDDVSFKDVTISSEVFLQRKLRYILSCNSYNCIGSLKNMFNDIIRCLDVLMHL